MLVLIQNGQLDVFGRILQEVTSVKLVEIRD
jgi:hypothetical protein